MVEIRLKPSAEADLKRIWTYIAHDNERAATRLLLRIEQGIRRLEDFPGMGAARDDVRRGCRLLTVAGYRVLYEIDAANALIEIVAVVEPYRDWPE